MEGLATVYLRHMFTYPTTRVREAKQACCGGCGFGTGAFLLLLALLIRLFMLARVATGHERTSEWCGGVIQRDPVRTKREP